MMSIDRIEKKKKMKTTTTTTTTNRDGNGRKRKQVGFEDIYIYISNDPELRKKNREKKKDIKITQRGG